MNILLINENPVVSRLFTLCTRDDSVQLDEVASLNDVQNSNYDMLFVDDASYNDAIIEFMETLMHTKKVFLSNEDSSISAFDHIIIKPFLPSQIIELVENIEQDEVEYKSSSIFPLTTEEKAPKEDETSIQKEKNPTVLDVNEIEKIKSLLEMDEDLEISNTALSEEEIEARKIQLIKEQLIADGLEIVDEDEIVQELSIDLDGTLNRMKKTKKKSKKKQKKSKKIKFTEKTMIYIEDAVEVAMANISKKQMKKLLKGKEIEVKIKLEEK